MTGEAGRESARRGDGPTIPLRRTTQPPSQLEPKREGSTINGPLQTKERKMNRPRLIQLMFISLGLLVGACNKDPAHAPPATASTPRPTARQPAAEPPADPPREEEEDEGALLVKKVITAETLPDAIAAILPKMTDTANDVSPGAVLMALWGAKKMRWEDVDIKKDETSFALVRKDADEARGKRMCVSGPIIQIQVEKLPTGKIATGLLMSYSQNLIHFAAVGSSGDLVEQHSARICGVVIGNYEYSNSGGGTGHAVQLVGMFDIKENNPKKASRHRSSDDDY